MLLMLTLLSIANAMKVEGIKDGKTLYIGVF